MSRKTKLVYVELNEKGRVSRIFRKYPEKLRIPDPTEFVRQQITQMSKTKAVAEVRHQIFIRSKGACEYCAGVITEQSGHMHEKVFRSHCGEISLANSVFVCYPCHRGEHGLGRGVA
jgi:5-methylcytosine-specific restriction endonuclease McrA